MDSLWAHWFAARGPASGQSLEFNCAKRLWLWNYHRTGRTPPIRLYAEEESVWPLNLTASVPVPCLPFIEHITINIPRTLLTEHDLISTFLSSFPSLRSLDLRLDNYAGGGWNDQVLWFQASPLTAECFPMGLRLTELRLTGATLTRYASSEIDLTSLTSLAISDLVLRANSEVTRLADIVRTTPNLLHLSLESNAMQFVCRTFWDPPYQGFHAYIPRLQSVKLSGDIVNLSRFVEALTGGHFLHLRAVTSKFLCDPLSAASLKFDAIPAFRSELMWHAHIVDFRENPYTIVTRRSPHALSSMEWDMQWVLCTNVPGPSWVCSPRL